MVPYCRLCVGLSCWLIWNSAMTAGRSALVSRIRVHNLHPPWPLCVSAHRAITRVAGKKRLPGIHRMGLPTRSIIKFFLCCNHPLMSNKQRAQMSLQSLSIQKTPSTDLIPNLPCHKFSNHTYSKSLAFQPESINKYRLIILTSYFSRQNKSDALLQVLVHQEDFPLPLPFRDIPERSCSDRADSCWMLPGISCRTTYKPGLNQLVIRNFP